jgi:hypothetical protein
MNRLFKVTPQYLNRIQVRTLTRPLYSLNLFIFKPFRGGMTVLTVFFERSVIREPLPISPD